MRKTRPGAIYMEKSYTKDWITKHELNNKANLESWNNITKCLVFRLVIGAEGAWIHWHWDWWDIYIANRQDGGIE